MAVIQKGNVIEVGAGSLGTADWSLTSPILIHSLQFVPSAAADIFVVKNISATGPVIYRHSTIDSEKLKYFPNSRMSPYVDISEATLASPAVAKLIIVKQDEERI